jgi:hypothetical protein
MPYAIKIVYVDGRKKIVGSHRTHEDAMKEKVRLMKKNEDADTEYYIVHA